MPRPVALRRKALSLLADLALAFLSIPL